MRTTFPLMLLAITFHARYRREFPAKPFSPYVIIDGRGQEPRVTSVAAVASTGWRLPMNHTRATLALKNDKQNPETEVQQRNVRGSCDKRNAGNPGTAEAIGRLRVIRRQLCGQSGRAPGEAPHT
jgi:hypothetical protein